MRLGLLLFVIALTALCLHGKAVQDGNRALAANCPHAKALTATWDGGTLVAVKCPNGRSYHR